MDKITKEERYFKYWLDELINNGYINFYIEQPDPSVLFNGLTISCKKKLKTKIVEVQRNLLQPWTYGCDYVISLNKNSFKLKKIFQVINNIQLPMPEIISNPGTAYVDVKPLFRSPKQAMSDNKFPLNQKAMFNTYGIFVNKVIPFKLFENTFTPKKVILEEVYQKNSKHGNKGNSKLRFNVRTIEQYLNQ